MRKGLMLALGLLFAAPVMAERFDCELDGYTYHQNVPCDHPDGFVYQELEAREAGRRQAQERAAQAAVETAQERAENRPARSTKAGYPACLTEQWLDDMVTFQVQRDNSSWAAYLTQERCVILGDGHAVTITRGPGLFGGKTEFVFNGVRLWTLREAIQYNR